MQINTNYSPSFGLIKPEHMYIRIPKYGTNLEWAEHAAGIANRAKDLPAQKTSFKKLFTFVCSEYSKFFEGLKSPITTHMTHIDDRDHFGRIRSWLVPETCIILTNRYSDYVNKFVNFLDKQGKQENAAVIMGLPKYLSSSHTQYSGNIPLSRVFRIMEELPQQLKDRLAGGPFIRVDAPEAEALRPVFGKMHKIYNKIIKSNDVEYITKNIARIHWYLSQLSPCCRGSAGCADITCKALFESKGIQVSSYKPGIDPNLEAYIMSLEKYAGKYKTFFETPPVKMLNG